MQRGVACTELVKENTVEPQQALSVCKSGEGEAKAEHWDGGVDHRIQLRVPFGLGQFAQQSHKLDLFLPRQGRECRLVRPPGACHAGGNQGNPFLRWNQDCGAPVHGVPGAGQQAPPCQAPHDALNRGRVHRGQASQKILGDLAALNNHKQGSKLRRGQAVPSVLFLEQGDMALMRPTQQEANMVFQEKPAAWGLLAIE
jgi:hypothetical protein